MNDKIKVLLVEDEASLAMIMKDTMEPTGMSVTLAADEASSSTNRTFILSCFRISFSSFVSLLVLIFLFSQVFLFCLL